MHHELIQAFYDDCPHAYCHEGGDESRQLEGVVDDVFAYMCGAGAIKANGSHLGGVVRQEEVAVDGGEEYKHHRRRHTQSQSHWQQCLYR